MPSSQYTRLCVTTGLIVLVLAVISQSSSLVEARRMFGTRVESALGVDLRSELENLKREQSAVFHKQHHRHHNHLKREHQQDHLQQQQETQKDEQHQDQKIWWWFTSREVKFDLLKIDNAQRHHTLRYTSGAADKPLVLRRGQSFYIKAEGFDLTQETLVFSLPNVAILKSSVADLNDKLIRIELPHKLPIGQHDLMLESPFATTVDKIVILFNPYRAADTDVYLPSIVDLKEYVENTVGVIFTQDMENPPARSRFFYEQFDSLPMVLAFIERLPLKARMSAAQVAAFFATNIRSPGDEDQANYLMRARWSSTDKKAELERLYEIGSGGSYPWDISNGFVVFDNWLKTGKHPVRWAQCFVLSMVTTTAMRSLGIPCRPVTGYDMCMPSDVIATTNTKIWNFHVWNEVWLRNEYSAATLKSIQWALIDSTSQITPSSVADIKEPIKPDLSRDSGVRRFVGELKAPTLIIPGPYKESDPNMNFNNKKNRKLFVLGRCGSYIVTKRPGRLPDRPVKIKKSFYTEEATRSYKYSRDSDPFGTHVRFESQRTEVSASVQRVEHMVEAYLASLEGNNNALTALELPVIDNSKPAIELVVQNPTAGGDEPIRVKIVRSDDEFAFDGPTEVAIKVNVAAYDGTIGAEVLSKTVKVSLAKKADLEPANLEITSKQYMQHLSQNNLMLVSYEFSTSYESRPVKFVLTSFVSVRLPTVEINYLRPVTTIRVGDTLSFTIKITNIYDTPLEAGTVTIMGPNSTTVMPVPAIKAGDFTELRVDVSAGDDNTEMMSASYSSKTSGSRSTITWKVKDAELFDMIALQKTSVEIVKIPESVKAPIKASDVNVAAKNKLDVENDKPTVINTTEPRFSQASTHAKVAVEAQTEAKAEANSQSRAKATEKVEDEDMLELRELDEAPVEEEGANRNKFKPTPAEPYHDKAWNIENLNVDDDDSEILLW